jgi:hypothetical protein
MIRNIIIIALLCVIVYDVSAEESLSYIQIGLDFLKEIVYNVERSVDKI